MLENKVGIWSNIENLLQNVLRELEQKKPQLDDLVRTADSLRDSPIKQKIPAKGKSRLNNLVRTEEKQFKLCLMSRPIQQQFLFKCTMTSTGLFENNGKNMTYNFGLDKFFMSFVMFFIMPNCIYLKNSETFINCLKCKHYLNFHIC